MSNVEFRLVVVRDKNSRTHAEQFEKDLLDVQRRYERDRVRIARKTETDINRVRGLATQREIQALKKQEAAGRAALRRRTEDYKRQKREELAALRKHNRDVLAANEAVQRQRRSDVGLGDPSRSSGRQQAAIVGGGALAFGGVALNAFRNFEQERNRIQALAGDIEGAQIVAGLRGISREIGTNFTELARTTSMLQAFEVQAEETVPILRSMSLIVGGNSERMSRLALAFGQANSMGRLYREEQKQMIEAGFNPLVQISRRTGESMASLMDRMEAGTLTMAEVKAAFIEATEAGGVFGNISSKIADSYTGDVNKMTAAWEEFKISIGETLVGTGGPGRVLQGIANNFGDVALNFRETVARLQGDFSTLVDVQTSRGFQRVRDSKPGEIDPNDPFAIASNLDKQLEKSRANLRKLQKEDEAALRREREAQEKAAQAVLTNQAEELRNQRNLARLRIDSANEELMKRKEIAEVAKKAVETARNNLTNARERFGQLSQEEQADTVRTVLQVRRQGVRDLSLEQIGQLQSLGTVEAQRAAADALRFRSGGQFGSEGLSAAQRNQRAAIRNSLFQSDRQAVRRAEANETRIEASIQQQVQFVANFDQTSQQIATEVGKLFDDALDKKNEEVIRLLQPIIDDLARIKQRQQAQNPGRSF